MTTRCFDMHATVTYVATHQGPITCDICPELRHPWIHICDESRHVSQMSRDMCHEEPGHRPGSVMLLRQSSISMQRALVFNAASSGGVGSHGRCGRTGADSGIGLGRVAVPARGQPDQRDRKSVV